MQTFAARDSSSGQLLLELDGCALELLEIGVGALQAQSGDREVIGRPGNRPLGTIALFVVASRGSSPLCGCHLVLPLLHNSLGRRDLVTAALLLVVVGRAEGDDLLHAGARRGHGVDRPL